MNKERIMRVALLSVILALSFSFVIPQPVGAVTIGNPNATAINETYIWRNVLETGDFLAISRYTVRYATIPQLDISQAFTFRLMNTSNTTEIGSTEAYPYKTSGYGEGIVSWYFPAASAPAWGSQYVIRIQGKSTAFTTPPVYSYPISTTSYTSLIATADVKKNIASRILSMASTLGTIWSVTMTEDTDIGTVLSGSGESYFSTSIAGIQSMAPSAFIFQVDNPDTDDDTWTSNNSNTMQDRQKTNDVGKGIQSLADVLSMDFIVTAAIPIVIICIVLIVLGSMHGNTLSGFMNDGFVLVGSAWAGFFPPIIMFLLAFLCGLYIGFNLIWKQS